jgi:hypothetical protein
LNGFVKEKPNFRNYFAPSISNALRAFSGFADLRVLVFRLSKRHLTTFCGWENSTGWPSAPEEGFKKSTEQPVDFPRFFYNF